MATKNNKRYKIRRMNTIKKPVNPLFNEPPKIVDSWEDLVGLKNDLYHLEIDVRRCCGRICSNDVNFKGYSPYLSTHTFYGNNYYTSTLILRNMGFNVQLINWDGDTQYAHR